MKNAKTGHNYFYDTYALIEVFRGNPNYADFMIEKDGITSRLNLMEVYRFLLRVMENPRAENYFDSLIPFTIEFEDDDIKQAVLLKEKDKNLSYIDCLGYASSLRRGIKFLTGDKEFSDRDDVLFLK
jgi:predicted nucleic acid-binding protein